MQLKLKESVGHQVQLDLGVGNGEPVFITCL